MRALVVVGRLVKTALISTTTMKYVNNTVEMEIPAQLPEVVVTRFREYTLPPTAHWMARVSQVDFFVTASHDIYINVNTMPGLRLTACILVFKETTE